ncbi:MAG: hypothetical protein WCI96_01770 [Planctomycetota bacterium]
MLMSLFIAASVQATQPDFTRDIAPMLERCCVSCHTKGGPGAYPFTTAGEVKRVARTALVVLESRTMPPWAPVEGVMRVAPKPTAAEIEAFRAWVDAGTPVAQESQALQIPARSSGAPVVASWRIAEGWTIDAEERRVMRSFQQPVGRRDAGAGASADTAARMLVGGWRARFDTPALVSTMLLTSGDAALAQRLDESDASIGFKLTGDLATMPAGALAGVGVDGVFALPAGFALEMRTDDALVAECHADGRGKREAASCTLEALAPVLTAAPAPRIVRPLIVSAQGSARATTDAARTAFEMPPLAAPLDLAAIVLRPGPDAVRVALEAIAPDGNITVLARVERYDIHIDRPYTVDPVHHLARGTRLRLTVDALNEILATRATPQAVLLVSAALNGEIGTSDTKNPQVDATTTTAPAPMGALTRAWIDQSVIVANTGLRATNPVPSAVFRETMGYDAEPRTGPSDAAGMTWFEAIALANELSRRDGLRPAYKLEFAQFDGSRLIGAVVSGIDANGWRLPTDAQWTITAKDAPAQRNGAIWNWVFDESTDATRVLRGGSWADPVSARGIDARSSVAPSTRMELFGARFVRVAP